MLHEQEIKIAPSGPVILLDRLPLTCQIPQSQRVRDDTDWTPKTLTYRQNRATGEGWFQPLGFDYLECEREVLTWSLSFDVV